MFIITPIIVRPSLFSRRIMEGKAADEEVMLLENWVEDDTVQAAAGAADYGNDLFIH